MLEFVKGVMPLVASYTAVRLLQLFKPHKNPRVDCEEFDYPVLEEGQVLMAWDVGGGFWTYYVGMCNYIQDHYDLSNVVHVGHSAGVEPTYWLSMDVPMSEVWAGYKEFNRHMDSLSLKAVTNWNFYCRRAHRDAIADMPRRGRDLNKMLEKCQKRHFSGATKLVWPDDCWFPRLRKTYWGRYKSFESAVACLMSSYTIPFITVPLNWPFQTVTSHHGHYRVTVDSWISHLSDDMHTYPYPDERVININPRLWHNFPLSMSWLWTGEEHVETMYRQGYTDAAAHPEFFKALTPKPEAERPKLLPWDPEREQPPPAPTIHFYKD